MAAPLTAEEEIRYTEIIDGILATADLETVTRKKIRMGLETALGGKDLSDQKHAIKALIEERFDAISSAAPPPSSAIPHPEPTSPRPSPKRQANGFDGNSHDIENDANGDEIKVSVQPPKKKQRKEKSEDTEDADAKLAALLQAQENQRTRATRGGGKPKAPAKKKKKATPRKKSDKKVGAEDDSDVEGSEESNNKPRKAGGGFQKPFNLSYPLAELCGEPQLSRPQVVKKLWEHIKGNQLQDPNDKRQIRCDEMMQAVFKQARVDMFQMNKLVGNHLYPVSIFLLSIIMSSAGGGSMDAPNGMGGSATSGPSRGRGDRNTRGRGRPRGRGDLSARGRGQGRPYRGRGRGGHAPATSSPSSADRHLPVLIDSSKPEQNLPQPRVQRKLEEPIGDEEDVEAEVCFICASPVIHQSVAPCNHRTCHICALRMRALYKNKECAHCRTLAPFVLFTDDAVKRFQDYSDADTTSTDDNIGIRYTNEDIVGDTVLLLRYNCPDDSCDFAGLGWPDLHRHVRSVHQKKMCDLCTRNKKVFTHEHELFTDRELEKHMRHGDDRPGAIDQTGFKGHPLCAFCGQRFYDDDKLYEHCRSKHERCFICDRQDPRQPHYYRDYNALEEHFKKDHFLCLDRECLEKKFVVFSSEIDLKAHQLSDHGSSLSKDVRRDARLVDLSSFDYRQPYQQERRSGGPGRDRDRDRDGDRERDRDRRGRGRDPNAEPLPTSSAQPLRRDELAFQRQMAVHSSQSVSNRTFGGQLSAPPSSNITGPSAQPSQRASSSSTPGPSTVSAPVPEMEGLSLADPNLTPEDRARLLRHSAVIERASNLLHNDRDKITSFRSHISSFRQDKVSAAALVDALFSLFSDASSSALGTLVREIADLFEDKNKGDRLRKAWNDWRAINEDYPTLPGLSGMHGATTSSTGWATAAASSPVTTAAAPSQRHTTRVLKLKSSTQQSRRSSVEQSSTVFSSAHNYRNPPPAAAASFPALPPSNPSPNGASRPSTTALWGSGGGSQAQPRPARPTNRDEAFPALPAAPKPTTTIFGYGTGSVRRDGGNSRNTGFSWGSSNGPEPTGDDAEEDKADTTGKGKKGNKGRKKVLVQWG
ncbi:uncharacterized protein GGS22DRAFT_182389 [Annulohypoxylon maeteangense]|uniref:uncharacterized protein n=1 Tax=Annulohypoxylon maeteangense TaxID=1927788 RepID=UPI00200882F4|nr:uncharacterized protein GGS22DRAFT_182389 [Annulohypoxylon maeteangense]KAI0880292.1 hypothetical protein GGS22DRAFT_182389 [Annulohypoxylon maeteangense]